MSNIAIIIIIFIILTGCQDIEDLSNLIEISYDGYFIVMIAIGDIDNFYYVYIEQYENSFYCEENFITDRMPEYSRIRFDIYKEYIPYDGMLTLNVNGIITTAADGMREAEYIYYR